MGQFSWLDCKNKVYPIRDNVYEPVYVLVPKEFKEKYADKDTGYIKEDCYDGYGRFGKYDIYDLVVDWNKTNLEDYLRLSKVSKEDWQINVARMYANGKTDKDIQDFIDIKVCNGTLPSYLQEDWKRNIGISIACYDEDNARLKYPIKITHNVNAVYEKCKPSLSDPNQGWGGRKYPYNKIKTEKKESIKINKQIERI